MGRARHAAHSRRAVPSRRAAVAFYQRQPSSARKRERNMRASTNLHGVDRLAKPIFRCALKAYRMTGKTQQRHCERSCGKNVLVLGKTRYNLLKGDNENVVIEQVPNQLSRSVTRVPKNCSLRWGISLISCSMSRYLTMGSFAMQFRFLVVRETWWLLELVGWKIHDGLQTLWTIVPTVFRPQEKKSISESSHTRDGHCLEDT